MIFKAQPQRLSLPEVTLIAVAGTARDVDAAQAALVFSAEEIHFAAVKLLSCQPPTIEAEGVEQHAIETLDWIGYNQFALHRLADYVNTPYCLLVQSDGFVLNPENWRDDFLQYDYIGAPWPASWNFASRVGNGGFSLRSKRLLELTRSLPYDQCLDWKVEPWQMGEDLWICHYAYDRLAEAGMRFPSVELAASFSREHPLEEGPVDLTRSFGFHGNKDLAAYLLEVGRNQFLDERLRDFSVDQLAQWVRHEAGTAHPDYFMCERKGGLALQQVPDEYARLLDFFRSRGIRRYLELGIGRAGSFMTNTLMMSDSLEIAHAVENCAYGQRPEELKLRLYLYLRHFQHQARFSLHLSSTQAFFQSGAGIEQYDCIFVDADHSYEGVAHDYRQALTRLAPGGCIVLHDIHSEACPGVRQLWSEIRHPGCREFIFSNTCGIGIWEPEAPADN